MFRVGKSNAYPLPGIGKKPEIYIFDDSFSALDFKTDAALRKALKDNIDKATMIIVAQRISTVVDAEQIIVTG